MGCPYRGDNHGTVFEELKNEVVNMAGDLKRERFSLPYLTLGKLARFLGLTPDTVWLLVKKGCLNPQRDREGKMIFKRNEVERWIREVSR